VFTRFVPAELVMVILKGLSQNAVVFFRLPHNFMTRSAGAGTSGL
jgi:hypothetical protein